MVNKKGASRDTDAGSWREAFFLGGLPNEADKQTPEVVELAQSERPDRTNMKYLLLTWLLITRPTWAWHWVWLSPHNPANSIKRHASRLSEYEKHELPLEDVVQIASGATRKQVHYVLLEARGVHVEGNPASTGISAKFDASPELAQLCYSLARLRKPTTVIETGVGRGVTTYHILRALRENDTGCLYSVELPMLKLGARKSTGELVPTPLRSKWALLFGPAEREIKKRSNEFNNLDLFIHDSSHTYLNQLTEYRLALHLLNKGGILVSDDVGNDALLEATEQFGSQLMVVKQQKDRWIGVVVKS